jgi:phosphatidylglycerol lysyltransferase
MSNVPGSLGVFESAVILLIRPADDQLLPLVGSLLAFRACYYLLPLLCGVTLLTLFELARWRGALARSLAAAARHLGPAAPWLAATLTAAGGALMLLATATPVPEARAERLAAALPGAFLGTGKLFSGGLGLSLLILARGLSLRVARAWGWGVALLLAGVAVCLATAESALMWLPLFLALAVLLLARREFARPSPDLAAWLTPGWLALIAGGAVLAVFVVTRG